MTRKPQTFEALQSEFPPIVVRLTEGCIEEASNRISTRFNTGLGLTAAGRKLAICNVETALTAMQVSADGWNSLAESASRTYQLVLGRGFDMWRLFATATAGLGNQPKSDGQPEQPAPDSLVGQAVMFNRTWLNAAQDMAHQLIDPVTEAVAKAERSTDSAGHDGDGRGPNPGRPGRQQDHPGSKAHA